MSLPFLPGYSFERNIGKDRYHKPHYFEKQKDVTLLVGESKPGIGGDNLPGYVQPSVYSKIPRGEAGNLPAWVAFDKQVLSFDAYFQEGVTESRSEKYRIRRVKIYFYLEDDSIQVVEPRTRNAGMNQGTIIKRHRIPKPPPLDNRYYTIDDFNLQNELDLYSRVFKIYDCDDFTRNFLTKLGVRVNPPIELPDDPYSDLRKTMDESMQPLRPYERQDTLKQFMDHDRHVLRFFCFWDDTENLYGDARDMVVHYFLSDDTIEVREVLRPNSGYEASPLFLSRQKVPKNLDRLRLPGEMCDRTVLNVLGSLTTNGRYILDNLKLGNQKIEYYVDKDLRVGSIMNVYGRKFLVYDCDAFTREYYKAKYSVDQLENGPVQVPRRVGPSYEKEIPPYNGFGSEEDSIGNCFSLIPKPPRRNFAEVLNNDRGALDSDVLRFAAKFVKPKSDVDRSRRFIISYFLTDQSILVFELAGPGIPAQKFLERTRIKKPNQARYGSTKMPEYFTASDFFIGQVVKLNEFEFQLVDADEYAFRYFETRPNQFPVADIAAIKKKIIKYVTGKFIEVRNYFTRQDPGDTGCIRYEQLHALLTQLCDSLANSLSEHEIMTVARHYAHQVSSPDDAAGIIASAQHQLRKKNYDDFDGLRQALAQRDKEKSDFLDCTNIMQVVHSVHLPVDDDHVHALLSLVEQKQAANGATLYNHKQLYKHLNWRENAVFLSAKQLKAMEVKVVDTQSLSGPSKPNYVDKINYRVILKDWFGEEALSV